MIYVDMKGNLGNQMFEYALARRIQQDTKETIVLNTYWLNKYRPDMTFSLKHFVLNDNIQVETDVAMPWYTCTYTEPIRLFKKIAPDLCFTVMKKFGALVYINRKFKNIPSHHDSKNLYIAGYWQCDKYFNEIRDIICHDFQPKYDRIESNAALYDVIENNESICVTVRCGDYMTNEKVRKHFLICTPEFYEEGVRRIKKVYPNAVVCVFSDDIQWCKNNLNFGNEVYYETGRDPVWEKIRMMSLCKHFVISNSSFSWWAQYLSQNKNKIVYAPKYWFPDRKYSDIYEGNWKYIDV